MAIEMLSVAQAIRDAIVNNAALVTRFTTVPYFFDRLPREVPNQYIYAKYASEKDVRGMGTIRIMTDNMFWVYCVSKNGSLADVKPFANEVETALINKAGATYDGTQVGKFIRHATVIPDFDADNQRMYEIGMLWFCQAWKS